MMQEKIERMDVKELDKVNTIRRDS